jgi:hypothetical protein
MATISSQKLTLTPTVENKTNLVIVKIEYDVTFTAAEETWLTSVGFKIQEIIKILGVNPGSPTDQVLLDNFLPIQDITVPVGGGTVPRVRNGKLLKTLLKGGSVGPNQIHASIQIIPVAAADFTPVQVLPG